MRPALYAKCIENAGRPPGVCTTRAATMPPHMPTQWGAARRPTRKMERKPESGIRTYRERPPLSGGSNHFRVAGPLPIVAQVAVEDHGYGPYQHAAAGKHRDPLLVHRQQAGLLHLRSEERRVG